MAQKAVTLEPRYSWAEIALARATIADKRLQPAERGLRFARQYSRFPTLDYELASALASMGLFDEAVVELKRSFTLKNGEIETKLAGRTAAHAATFTELLAPERRAAIFQKTAADTEANANMLKGLFAFDAALNQASMSEDDLLAVAQQFIKGDDAMRTLPPGLRGRPVCEKGCGPIQCRRSDGSSHERCRGCAECAGGDRGRTDGRVGRCARPRNSPGRDAGSSGRAAYRFVRNSARAN